MIFDLGVLDYTNDEYEGEHDGSLVLAGFALG